MIQQRPCHETGQSYPMVQISVVVAAIQSKTCFKAYQCLMTGVEKVSVPTAVEYGLVGPESSGRYHDIDESWSEKVFQA